MNEAETRAEHIDPALAAAGWGVAEGSRIRREYSITLGRLEGAGKRGKPLTADYVLEYRNTKLAVVEAKAWDKALTEGVAQAKDYAGKLAVRFTYSTNGQGIYGIDMASGAEGEIQKYPSPDELWNRTFATKSAWRDRFAAVAVRRNDRYTAACLIEILNALCPGSASISKNSRRVAVSIWSNCDVESLINGPRPATARYACSMRMSYKPRNTTRIVSRRRQRASN